MNEKELIMQNHKTLEDKLGLKPNQKIWNIKTAINSNQSKPELLNQNNLNIIYDFINPLDAYANQELAPILSKKNFMYLQAPLNKEEFEQALNQERFANEALQIHHQNNFKLNQARQILHRAHKGFDDEWLKEAKDKLGIKGKNPLDQLEKIANKEQPLVNQHLPGLFVDLDGTLIRGEKLDEGVLKTIANYENGPINLWTGGNIDFAINTLKELNFTKALQNLGSYKFINIALLSKNALNGASVDMAIDDLTPEELSNQYNITAKKYIKINWDAKKDALSEKKVKEFLSNRGVHFFDDPHDMGYSNARLENFVESPSYIFAKVSKTTSQKGWKTIVWTTDVNLYLASKKSRAITLVESDLEGSYTMGNMGDFDVKKISELDNTIKVNYTKYDKPHKVNYELYDGALKKISGN